jgi:transcription-repair coupling factor (superfamily II helicase)
MFNRFEEDQQFKELADAVNSGRRLVRVSGLVGGAKALTIAALQRATSKRLAVITVRERDVEDLERDLRLFESAQPGSSVYSLPGSEGNPYSGTSPHAEFLERRGVGLWRLASGAGRIVLMTARSLFRRYVAPEEIKRSGVVVKVGEELPLEYLIDHLAAVGYVRSDPVGGVGEFSSRGGILDFYSPIGRPARVEFFGDTIDSIREFDPDSQRSVGETGETVIVPMRDERATSSDFRKWARAAREQWHDERYSRALRDRLVFAGEGAPFPGWEFLMPLANPLPASIFDYLDDTILVIDEPAEVEKRVRSILDELSIAFDRTEQADELAISPDRLFLTPDELRKQLDARARIELRLLGASSFEIQNELETENIVAPSLPSVAATSLAAPAGPLFLFPPEPGMAELEIASRAVRRWHGRLNDLAADLRQRAGEREETCFVLPTVGVAERLRDVLNEYEIAGVQTLLETSTSESAYESNDAAPITIMVGDLSVGFALPSLSSGALTIYSEGDLYAETAAVQRPAGKRLKSAPFLSDFRDLKVGDFIVHIDHGIGQFQGLVQLDTEGTETPADTYARLTGIGARSGTNGKREFMLLTYADHARLYVPVERLDLVQKYSSGEGHTPTLDRLGGIAWQKTKARAKRAMRDMAEELLKLYAERTLVHGHSFSGDSPWQQEFEEAFAYELTTDQARAITDTKQDMEAPTPMDRLLCGDVGYGKTEIAMRAAFKAVMDGKQVAVLAPTTVLAYQHYQTFRARFAAFPARIELLSRLRSPKEQRQVVSEVEAGAVDVLIGTHRILSRDIQFKDLGLVIIDEEQRFGVAHKERLKHLKKRVDVLTLTATPIPRTLNMSLLGLRDMSVIETPPRDRLAIQTNVLPFAEGVIRSAIELELQRQGQVFVVHNRVESINTIAELIQRIVPGARLIVAHGQMAEKQMEQAVLDFVAHKYDVLVATTIIENGIDIPRANTIIVNRADAYGLAQLYQLRGRVGRSNRRAYAYLLIPTEQELTPIARRRLAAIREFSDLGAGFRIAALDLELRGAGSLLGGEQSGHIDAIGFDLYCQMLERTVAELRGEEIEEEIATQLNLGIEMRIPDEYISDMSHRLRTYKRIASARSDGELSAIRDELSDRYGRIPHSIENLFSYARARREAERLGLMAIDRVGNNLVIRLNERARVKPERLVALLHEDRAASLTPGGVLKVKLAEGEVAAEMVFDTLNQVFARLAA